MTDAAPIQVTLTYGRGAVWGLCRCGKAFWARGSAGICRFMELVIATHRCVNLQPTDQLSHSDPRSMK